MPAPTSTMVSQTTLFAHVPFADRDAVFDLEAAFERDESPLKMTLAGGVYRHGTSDAWILPSVRMAKKRLPELSIGHEYLPLIGLPAFRLAAQKVIFGTQSRLLEQGQVATLQTIAGTGAIHTAAMFIRQFHSPDATVYVSRPSWPNHRQIFAHAGFQVNEYPYWDGATRNVDFEGMLESIQTASPGSVFILHACAHNPTGCDLTRYQWDIIGRVIRERQLVPVLDTAYQGFASGDLDNDAWAVRHLLDTLSSPGIVCQSFSKNMGLYGERVGALHIVTSDHAHARNVESQLEWISRKEISTPGRYGATIAAVIVHDPKLNEQWCQDMISMSSRIRSMRQAVVGELRRLGTPGRWDHILGQIGMFSYTGLTPNQAAYMRTKHIYMPNSGRIAMPGLTSENVGYFCHCLDEAVRTVV